MSNIINGRTVLRPLEGRKATGMCVYSWNGGTVELRIAAQSFERDASLTAMVQYGPEAGYRCHGPEEVGDLFTISGAMPAALWVLDRGRPVLFGRLNGSPFDQGKARALLSGFAAPAKAPPLKAMSVPPPSPVEPAPTPPGTGQDKEPAAPSAQPDTDPVVQSLCAPPPPDPAQPAAAQAMEPAIVLPSALPTLEPPLPASEDEGSVADAQTCFCDEPGEEVQSCSCDEGVQACPREPDEDAQTCSCDEPDEEVQSCSCDEPDIEATPPEIAPPSPDGPQTIDVFQEAVASAAPFPGSAAAPALQPAQAAGSAPELNPGYLPPLTVRRAIHPTAQTSVYSPLWDDVSAEFEKMLDSLPSTNPFAGGTDSSRFSQLPLGDAVQCYIGSVTINGMRVYLQAVPARPYGRPAGFDHTLVSRDGNSFWVKYFISN